MAEEDKLASLRSLMASHSPPLHALVVPSEDYHQVSSFQFLFSLSSLALFALVFRFFLFFWMSAVGHLKPIDLKFYGSIRCFNTSRLVAFLDVTFIAFDF